MHFYQKYHLDGAHRQMQLFSEIVHSILEIVETEEANSQLDKLGVWEWCTLKSGKKWPLSKWIQVNTVAPYKQAIKTLRQASSPDPDENQETLSK